MVGLMATALLLKHGFSVKLIDDGQAPEPPPPLEISARVSALNQGSFNLFQKLGVVRELTTHARAYHQMKIWDQDPPVFLDFNASSLFEPWLGWIIDNRAVRHILWHFCQPYLASGQLEAHWGFQARVFDYTHGFWKISGGDLTLEGQFLMGADGGSSGVRESQQIALQKYDYHQSALVTVLDLRNSHQNTAWQRFLPAGPLALLPLKDSHQGAMVWSTSHTHAASLQSLPESEFLALWNQVFHSSGLTAHSLLCERKFFPLTSEHAKRYTFEGGVLVGDAAHKIHPLAGQGVNLGWMDVAALVSLMVRAKTKSRSPFGAHVSAQYACERRLANQLTQKAMTVLNQVYGMQTGLVSTLRSCVTRQISRQRWLQLLLLEPALSRLPLLCEKFL